MATITANGTFHGHELKDMPVINPGDWFGKTWLIEIGGGYSPIFIIVEADSVSNAIDELADHEKDHQPLAAQTGNGVHQGTSRH